MPLPSAPVSFSTHPDFTGLVTGSQTTDSSGQVPAMSLTAATTGSKTINATVYGQPVTGTITIAAPPYELVAVGVTGGGSFTTSTTATIEVELLANGVPHTATSETITWSIVSADNSANPGVASTYYTRTTGLRWGSSATTTPGTQLTSTTSSLTNTADGRATIDLTDIMGERTVKVRATVTLASVTYTVEQDVIFGNGLLSTFRVPTGSSGDWDAAYLACNGYAWTGGHPTPPSIWVQVTTYHGSPRMATTSELQAIFGASGAAFQAAGGWPTISGEYWTGIGEQYVYLMDIVNASGSDSQRLYSLTKNIICRR